MTTLQLLGYISAALLLQMAVGLGIAFRRLRLKAHEPVASDAVAALPAAAGAWPGWREHTLANVRQEHEEEGIRNFGNCVKCHRSADEEPRGEGGGDRKDDERD
ncbi:hypothetical protein [Hydrogenophaga sp.]|uniref:hypothetical protein n=1 Tax=Hydrogenophaga sp. TaxID=1904254 RepID=UPI002733DAC8|nr:hypothetical protein [Hydrogenophaga sp.]MDP3883938.1 hypothetical protein [Hydrogenophaga sp.]MDZ4358380.1 hypothetical protein [Variovorax sp.]